MKYLIIMVRSNEKSVQAATYCAPQITAQSYAVERGFSLSQEMGLPGETPVVNDYGEF